MRPDYPDAFNLRPTRDELVSFSRRGDVANCLELLVLHSLPSAPKNLEAFCKVEKSRFVACAVA